MTVSLSNTSKTTVTITNSAKGPDTTWDEATYTWDQAEGTWDVPGTVVLRESKTNVTITAETKN